MHTRGSGEALTLPVQGGPGRHVQSQPLGAQASLRRIGEGSNQPSTLFVLRYMIIVVARIRYPTLGPPVTH